MSDLHEKYRYAITRSCEMAGPGDEHWNFRYLAALQIFGLRLDTGDNYNDGDYPDGSPTIAPVPCLYDESGVNWSKESRIVWVEIDPSRHRIVSAAIRGSNGFLIIGIRHYDAVMRIQILTSLVPDVYANRLGVDQGFVDNHGVYRGRQEAFIIAKNAGQLEKVDSRLQHLLDRQELYSEMLY